MLGKMLPVPSVFLDEVAGWGNYDATPNATTRLKSAQCAGSQSDQSEVARDLRRC